MKIIYKLNLFLKLFVLYIVQFLALLNSSISLSNLEKKK